MNSTDETKGISALLMIDVIGKPPEHLTETLNNIIKKMSDEKGVHVIGKKMSEPTLMKNQKDFYTSFAEVEVEVDEIFDIIILMFKYMPAHIDIIYPELIALTNNGWTEILNELTRRLHGYDEIARIVNVEKSILEKKLRGVLEDKNKTVKEKKVIKKKKIRKKKS